VLAARRAQPLGFAVGSAATCDQGATNTMPSAIPSDAVPAFAPREFRVPLSMRILSLAGIILLGVVSLAMTVLAATVFRTHWALGLFILTTAFFMGALTGYVWRDLAGKWNLRVMLERDAVILHLPANRSLIHRPQAQHLVIPYGDIAAIETRLEAYRSFGFALLQRPYVLLRRGGELIFLLEDRALATGMRSTMAAEMVTALAARAHCPVRDLGMVEGKGGVLAVWGTHPPDRSTPSLPLAQQMRLWGRAAATGMAIPGIFIILQAVWALLH
jgi:hypothetical protein